MTESFAPGVIIDGKFYTPPGWMWVLGFALDGVEWAIREADTSEFRATARAWLVKNRCDDLQRQLADCERRLAELRQELHINTGNE